MVFSVSAVSEYIARKFKSDTQLKGISVVGEISNFKLTDTGTSFFVLKDKMGVLNCTMFESDLLTEGERVVAKGNLSYYPRDGKVIFYVDGVEQEGKGDLFAKLEQLKKKLVSEGLFDEAHKKPLPPFPKTIGIITSASGAAIHDIISTAKSGYMGGEFILYPSKVQGEGAAEELAEGIRYFRANPVDVLIIGRGGGSFEDLYAFNDEALVREIYACDIPVVSAVGHEIDYTLCDFVADARAATPTAAVALCLKRLDNLRDQLNSLKTLLFAHSPQELLKSMSAQVEEMKQKLQKEGEYFLTLKRSKLERLSAALSALSPYDTLKRGYAIVMREAGVITTAKDVEPGQVMQIRFADGSVEVRHEKHL